MIGTPEGAMKRHQDNLVRNMLAADARRHEGETNPPRDRHVPELSVTDTAFLSPEQHAELAHESYWAQKERRMESGEVYRDYPEDWVLAATGIYGLGKGLTKAALARILNQQARKRRLEYTRSVLRPQAQLERRVRHSDDGISWGSEGNFRNIHARRRDPSTLRKASKKYRDEGELAEDVYGDPVNDPEAFAKIDQDFDLYATREEMDLLEGTDALGKVMGRDRSVHDWIDDIEWPRIKASNPPPPRPHGPPRPPSPGVKGGHEGYSELPRYMTRDELWELFRRGGPRPSANSIIPAAVLMDSMILEE